VNLKTLLTCGIKKLTSNCRLPLRGITLKTLLICGILKTLWVVLSSARWLSLHSEVEVEEEKG